VRAGVSSIEHGSFLDEEAARMMAERGTFLVPTLMAGEAAQRAAKNGVLKGLRAEKAFAAAAAMRRGIKIAMANKVQIALGTDADVIPHGQTSPFQLHFSCDHQINRQSVHFIEKINCCD
jgi:imidazolonepropionase-like amidohydrolase